MTQCLRRIAMVDTDGGDGIGGYTYELSEALTAQGVAVDVFTNSRGIMHELPLPRRHHVIPVLGAPLFRQRHRLRHSPAAPNAPVGRAAEPAASGGESHSGSRQRGPLRTRLRQLTISLEFALYLKSRYDLVWIQWASDAYASSFYTLCRRIGLPVVHTVHNVLPHESREDDVARYGELYRKADALIVHSRAARDELLQLFPATAGRIVESRIGLYTMFARNPGGRDRTRHALGVGEQQPLLLMFGGIRPYKNVDVALSALTAPLLRDVVLVVAGRESGYAEASAADPLARTRTIADRFGVSARVRFLPGRLNMTETADLFEASDVLMLPYTQSYGSAALLLGMTFGKHIIATRIGGMEEYLADYPSRTLLAGSDAPSVAAGIFDAVCSLRAPHRVDEVAGDALRWPRIASELLTQVWNQLSTARRQFPMRVPEKLKTSRPDGIAKPGALNLPRQQPAERESR